MSNLPPRGDPYWEDFDQISPWHIMDGKWGGWGPSYWRRAHEFGFAKSDVVEWRRVEGKQEWYRVWIEADNKWRELTAEEITRLPVFKPFPRLRFDQIPAWPLKGNPEATEVLAAILAQPTLQVIEQAPVIVKQFETKPLDTPSQVG